VISWDALDAERLREAWADLEVWVDKLRSDYSAVKLPDCWPRHPDLVAELIAFRARWRDIYAAPEGDGDPKDAIQWHESLYIARERWREVAKSCFGKECARTDSLTDDERQRTREHIQGVLGSMVKNSAR
jgi:hypothetical protein